MSFVTLPPAGQTVVENPTPTGAYVPASATQGGTAGSPALTHQWSFQPENTTHTLGPFGSAFWPGTFGGVVETSWDFGYNSPNLSGYAASTAQGFFSILPDCGDTSGLEIEAVFTHPDGTSCFPFQFVGQTGTGVHTGQWLFSLPKGDGSFTFGVKNAGGTVDAYLSMSGLEAATAAAPGTAGFGTSSLPITLSVSGAILPSQRVDLQGTAGVANSLSIHVGLGASAPTGVDAQLYLQPKSGQNSILSFAPGGTEQWRHITNGTDGYLRIVDVVNARNAMTFQPGTTSTSLITINGPMYGFYGIGMYNKNPPAAQPSAPGTATGYTAGATAATFHSDDTYTGNSGTTGYTVNGIVAALKAVGVLAA